LSQVEPGSGASVVVTPHKLKGPTGVVDPHGTDMPADSEHPFSHETVIQIVVPTHSRMVQSSIVLIL
jgi:hypothetical protein